MEYSWAEEEQHLEEYRKVIPHLSVYDTYEVGELRWELEEVRESRQTLEDRTRQLELLMEARRLRDQLES